MTQGIHIHTLLLHASTTSSKAKIKDKSMHPIKPYPQQPPLIQLEPLQTHATGVQRSQPVRSANLKRKRRSWWGAVGLVQRRPFEGCRAEKILRNIETWKREQRKRGGKVTKQWTRISEWVRRKTKAETFCSTLLLESTFSLERKRKCMKVHDNSLLDYFLSSFKRLDG